MLGETSLLLRQVVDTNDHAEYEETINDVEPRTKYPRGNCEIKYQKEENDESYGSSGVAVDSRLFGFPFLLIFSSCSFLIQPVEKYLPRIVIPIGSKSIVQAALRGVRQHRIGLAGLDELPTSIFILVLIGVVLYCNPPESLVNLLP